MVEIPLEYHSGGRRPTVLVAGDTICNVQTWGTVHHAPTAAPMCGEAATATLPVFRSAARQVSLGGAASAAVGLSALGCDVRLLSTLGADVNGRRLRELLRQHGITDTFVLEDVTRPTTTRTYLVAQDRRILRLDHESRASLSSSLAARLLEYLDLLMVGVDGIVCYDHGYGVSGPGLLENLLAASQGTGCPIFIDFEGQDPALYRGATALVARFGRIERTSHTPPGVLQGVEEVAECLLGPSQVQALLLDRSPDGLSLFCPPEAPLHISARPENGAAGNGHSASDGLEPTVIASFSAAVLNGLPMAEAARLAAESALL
jgi:D-beta-D-heptose 7-phosphate kinase/D-beta-D-heptose 1-phosphate adenosyltransferase